jgi:uncharacterized protein
MANRRTSFSYILIGVLAVFGIAYVARPFLTSGDSSISTATVEKATAVAAPAFVKEGEVRFLQNGKVVQKIDVEVAENDSERAKGLMFRPFMPDTVGMLFVFERSEPQGFWMKNTMISLDIIYVNEQKKIISIQKNATPYSEQTLPSFGNAQYVVEVNGGYCERNGIKVGDSILF